MFILTWRVVFLLFVPPQVLLVTSSRRPELWIVPGGGVEPDEEPAVTAVREVLEEAGVVGTLGRCLGTFEVCEKNSGHFTHHRHDPSSTSPPLTSTQQPPPPPTTPPKQEHSPTTPTTTAADVDGGNADPPIAPSAIADVVAAARPTTTATNTGLASPPQNLDHKHRTEVFVMTVTEELVEWEDSRSIGRNRQWFTIDDALNQLALHKPTQRSYLQELRHSKIAEASSVVAVDEPAAGAANNTATVPE